MEIIRKTGLDIDEIKTNFYDIFKIKQELDTCKDKCKDFESMIAELEYKISVNSLERESKN